MNALNEAMWEQPNFWREGTFQAYKHYMDSAFRTYTGVGNDAQIKTNADQKRQLPNWKPEWEKMGEKTNRELSIQTRGAHTKIFKGSSCETCSVEKKSHSKFFTKSPRSVRFT
jgi:hypothetical protein